MTAAVERVVVALDAASENRAAIGAAARLAARWKARLHGVFVEDDDLIRLAHLPFARQVTLGIGVEPLTLQHAERQIRVFAERAVVTISPASPWARAARAIEPPIRPKPISAMRLKGGSVLTCPP